MPWTIETLKEHIDTRLAALQELLAERARRGEERHEAAQQSIANALASADKATDKATDAIERRLEGVNEFRAALDDRQRTLMPRSEAESMFAALRERVERLEQERTGATSEKAGTKAGYLWAIGAVGIIATIITAAVSVAAFLFATRGPP